MKSDRRCAECGAWETDEHGNLQNPLKAIGNLLACEACEGAVADTVVGRMSQMVREKRSRRRIEKALGLSTAQYWRIWKDHFRGGRLKRQEPLSG